MNIVIINWRGGENDPFTYFSACMKQAFERMGRPTHVVDLAGRHLLALLD